MIKFKVLELSDIILPQLYVILTSCDVICTTMTLQARVYYVAKTLPYGITNWTMRKLPSVSKIPAEYS